MRAYEALSTMGREPLLDDTQERPGAKFATADLIGLPWQLIIGPRGLAEDKVELKRRAGGERRSLSLDEALAVIGG
jgi:prolyl-tRNA synthetase